MFTTRESKSLKVGKPAVRRTKPNPYSRTVAWANKEAAKVEEMHKRVQNVEEEKTMVAPITTEKDLMASLKECLYNNAALVQEVTKLRAEKMELEYRINDLVATLPVDTRHGPW